MKTFRGILNLATYCGLIVMSLTFAWARAEPVQVPLEKTESLRIQINAPSGSSRLEWSDQTRSALERINSYLEKADSKIVVSLDENRDQKKPIIPPGPGKHIVAANTKVQKLNN